MIPHPLYRDQATPESYCNNCWACHRGCNNYTAWKIEDPNLVPAHEIPDSWEEFKDKRMQAVRDKVAAKLKGNNYEN